MSDTQGGYQCVNVYATSASTENLSRHEMLGWVNDCLQSSYKKIEELCSGKFYKRGERDIHFWWAKWRYVCVYLYVFCGFSCLREREREKKEGKENFYVITIYPSIYCIHVYFSCPK